MRQEKLSSEEVIKIPSSFRIIKREDVANDSGLSLIETKMDFQEQRFNLEDEMLEEDFDENEEEIHEDIDIDKIKKDIRKQIYREIENEKVQIINKANEEADSLKLEAKQQGYKDGIRKGFVEGYDKGKEEAQKDCQEMKESAIQMVAQAEDYIEEYYEENQKRIIRLAGDMAESIIHKSIDTSSENIAMLIKPIIQQYRKKEQIIITAHPENCAFLKNNLNRLIDHNEDTKFVILEDPSLEKNGCTIENENQIIDLQIRKQIENVIDEINNME